MRVTNGNSKARESGTTVHSYLTGSCMRKSVPLSTEETLVGRSKCKLLTVSETITLANLANYLRFKYGKNWSEKI